MTPSRCRRDYLRFLVAADLEDLALLVAAFFLGAALAVDFLGAALLADFAAAFLGAAFFVAAFLVAAFLGAAFLTALVAFFAAGFAVLAGLAAGLTLAAAFLTAGLVAALAGADLGLAAAFGFSDLGLSGLAAATAFALGLAGSAVFAAGLAGAVLAVLADSDAGLAVSVAVGFAATATGFLLGGGAFRGGRRLGFAAGSRPGAGSGIGRSITGAGLPGVALASAPRKSSNEPSDIRNLLPDVGRWVAGHGEPLG